MAETHIEQHFTALKYCAELCWVLAVNILFALPSEDFSASEGRLDSGLNVLGSILSLSSADFVDCGIPPPESILVLLDPSGVLHGIRNYDYPLII